MSSNYYTCNYCLITVQIGWNVSVRMEKENQGEN